MIDYDEVARDLIEKMRRNEHVSRWDVYYNRQNIRELLEPAETAEDELALGLLEEYIESVLETL